jgi:hypothetical protein
VQGKLAITTAHDRKLLAWMGLRPAARGRNGLQARRAHAMQVGSQTLIRLYVLHEQRDAYFLPSAARLSSGHGHTTVCEKRTIPSLR